MKSREISRSEIGPFSLAYTDPYIGIGWEYQSSPSFSSPEPKSHSQRSIKSLHFEILVCTWWFLLDFR